MPARRVRSRVSRLAKRLRLVRSLGFRGLSAKTREELDYWHRKRTDEVELRNEWYRDFYTEHFGFDEAFFAGKRILDVGCGPRGSLEWAGESLVRLGVDPLAHRYRGLGTQHHQMSYVAAAGEQLPLRSSSVDVVSSFNSLDHTDDLPAVVDEIVRVLAPGGTFLLIVDINHRATDSEPLTLTWDVVDRFVPSLHIASLQQFEHAGGVYQSILTGDSFNHELGSERRGVLSATFNKPSS